MVVRRKLIALENIGTEGSIVFEEFDIDSVLTTECMRLGVRLVALLIAFWGI